MKTQYRMSTNKVENMKSYLKNFKITREFIDNAYNQWTKAESGHKNKWRVQEEYGNKDILINEIYNELQTRTITFRPIHRYKHLEESNSKIRILGVESVKQQIIDYIVVLALDEFLYNRIGYWQLSGIKKRGACKYIHKVQKWTRTCKYHVHIDIKQFYPSIPKSIVYNILKKYIRSDEILYLSKLLLNSYNFGLELGSYFSLCMANLVISFALHYLEDWYIIDNQQWLKHQLWYMDDGYLFADDSKYLEIIMENLTQYMWDNFKLEFKDWKVCHHHEIYKNKKLHCFVNKCEPVDLAGFRITPTSITLRKNLFRRLLRAYKRFDKQGGGKRARRCCSYWGYLKYTNSLGVRRRYGLDRIFNNSRALISILDKRSKNAENS